MFVSDELIKEKGRSLLKEVNMQLPEGHDIVLQFSSGWLHKFKKGMTSRLISHMAKLPMLTWKQLSAKFLGSKISYHPMR